MLSRSAGKRPCSAFFCSSHNFIRHWILILFWHSLCKMSFPEPLEGVVQESLTDLTELPLWLFLWSIQNHGTLLSEMSRTSPLSPLFSFLHVHCHCPAQFWLHGESDGSPDPEGLWLFGFKHLCGLECLGSFQNPPRNPCTQLVLNRVKPLPVPAAVLKLACTDL